jgi:Domain of unknown function (DUF4175)
VEPSRPPESLGLLADVWQGRVQGSMRAALRAALVAAVFCVAHVARIGTAAARWGSAAAVLTALIAYAVRARRARLRWRDPRFVVSRTITPGDPDLGARTLRALRLAARTAVDVTSGSRELAREHLSRLVARVNPADVETRAARVAGRWYRIGLLAALGAVGAVAAGPFRIVEGFDVLLARNGAAPLDVDWIDAVVVSAHPPEYLRENDVTLIDPSEATLPNGTVITVSGVPVHAGRRLVLTDGDDEVTFVDDGHAGVVARWTLSRSVSLCVAARFGDTLIRAPGVFVVTSLADRRPDVRLAGAPRTVRLIDEPRIDLDYEATDDHGLTQIDLVIRSGVREERRVLATLNGDAQRDRGAQVLRATDPYFKRAFAPVEVTIEARDDDATGGPKWGSSAAITIIPPLVGEPEAGRYEALTQALDSLVDLLAHRMSGAAGQKDHVRAESDETVAAVARLDEAVSRSYGGLRMPRWIRAAVANLQQGLRRAMNAEERSPTAATHAANRKAAEEATLTMNAVAARISAADAAKVARRLADVADDVAEGAAAAAQSAQRRRGLVRLQAALGVLDGAGAWLRRLGALGDDLGEIVANDVKRVRRARSADDFVHAELAARDLAARLRQPAPSFEGGRRSGVEAGWGGAMDLSEPSAGSDRAAREQEQIDDLADDHASELWGVQQVLGAANAEDDDGVLDEAKAHARAVREAVGSLPSSGGEPGSAQAAAASGRELARAMADDLERGGFADAVKSGRGALAAFGRADRAAGDRSPFPDARARSRRAAEKIEPEVVWAERALDRIRRAASARAGPDLRAAAPRESALADRARAIARDARSGSGAVDEPTMDLLEAAEQAMRQAAGALGALDADQALDRQREAQRLLDMAGAPAQADDGSADASDADRTERSRGDADGAGDFRKRGYVPRAGGFKGPETFRRRVVEGLAAPADPRLRDAVRRYAQGLLR